MAQLQDFFDSFMCKVCFQFYTHEQPPLIICNNRHLLCERCVSTIEQKSKKEFKSSLKCPFCKEQHKEFSEISQDRQVLQIKSIVAKLKRHEANQNDQIAFLRRSYQKLEEENVALKENARYTQGRKDAQKKLVCYCKNKYFSNPIEQIKVHIESICELLKTIKRRQQDKMILPSLFFNEPVQAAKGLEDKPAEIEWPLQEKQHETNVQSLQEIFPQLINQSFQNVQIMKQMINAYREKQAYLKDRQKWIDKQLKEKEGQIKQLRYQILQYKWDYKQLIKDMQEVRQQLNKNMKEKEQARQQLNKRIKEKDDQIRVERKRYKQMEEQYQQTFDQLHSEFKQLQASYQQFINKDLESLDLAKLTHIKAQNPENQQKQKSIQKKKIKQRRSVEIQHVKATSNKRFSIPNFIKERTNIPQTARNPEKEHRFKKVQTQSNIKLEMTQLLEIIK